MNLMVHLVMNEDAWSEATTTDERRLSLDAFSEERLFLTRN